MVYLHTPTVETYDPAQWSQALVTQAGSSRMRQWVTDWIDDCRQHRITLGTVMSYCASGRLTALENEIYRANVAARKKASA